MTVNPGAAASSANISGSVAVYFDPANPSVNATFSSSSLEVTPTTGSRILYDAGHQAVRALIVGSQSAASLQVSGITNSISTHIVSTGGTLGVRVGQIDGSVAVYFSPANPAVSATFSGSISAVPETGQGEPLFDEATNALKVQQKGTFAVYFDQSNPAVNVGSPTITGITNSIAAHVLSTGGTLQVALKPGTIAVSLDPGHTLGNIGTIGSITNTVAVFFSPANPAVAATFSGTVSAVPETGQGEPIYDESKNALKVVAAGVTETFTVKLDRESVLSGIQSTIRADIGKISDTMAVYLTGTAGTIGVNVGKISDTVAVYVFGTAGTIITKLDRESVLSGIQSTVQVNVGKISDTVAVYLAATAGTIQVALKPGTIAVSLDPGHLLGDVRQAKSATGTFSKVEMATAARQILAANAARLSASVIHDAPQTMYIGLANTVTSAVTGLGFPIIANQPIIFDDYTGAIFGVVESGAVTVKYIEI